MPRKSFKPAAFVRRVLPRPEYIFDPSFQWFVVRTNIKCEHRACLGLDAIGVPSYRPVQHVQRIRRRRLCEDIVLAVPRYIFVGLDPDHPEFGAVRAVNGVLCQRCHTRKTAGAATVSLAALERADVALRLRAGGAMMVTP